MKARTHAQVATEFLDAADAMSKRLNADPDVTSQLMTMAVSTVYLRAQVHALLAIADQLEKIADR